MEQKQLFDDYEPVQITEGYTCINCDVYQPADQFQHMLSGEVKRKCRTCARNQSKLLKELKKVHEYPDDNYICPGCNRPLDVISQYGQKKLQNWVMDHCHKSLKFRGWLCHHCNTTLGAANDELYRLKNLVKYLEEFNEKEGHPDDC